MEKNRWLDFLSPRLRSQISLENAEKAQTWAFALLGLISFGAALAAVGASQGRTFLASTKVLFLVLFYLILLVGVHLPSRLQRGEKPIARLLGVRDFVSLSLISITIAFYAVVIQMLSHQFAASLSETGGSNFLGFVAWTNDVVIFIHTAACFFFLASLLFFPKGIAKALEHAPKFRMPLLWIHGALALLLSFGYTEFVAIGSPDFFEQLRVAGLFWISIGCSLLLVGKLLHESTVPALAALELDVASGRLERSEDIMARFKDAFVSRRLVSWIGRIARSVADKTEKIARFSHEAVTLVSREKPSEVDLTQVEDRYRRAESLHRKLEKENQRFLLSISLFDLSDAARVKVEELREQISRELRNAKLEVASVRKRIDEQLTALRSQMPQPASPTPVPVSSSPSR